MLMAWIWIDGGFWNCEKKVGHLAAERVKVFDTVDYQKKLLKSLSAVDVKMEISLKLSLLS